MNDFQTYGSDEKKAERWGRVVRALDDWFPQWRVSSFYGPGSDDAARVIGDTAVAAIRKLSGKDVFSPVFANPAPPQVPPQVPDHSTWDGSYTKRIADLLQELFPNSAAGYVSTPRYVAICNAIRLLKEYHRTQHEVYEQRDAAREELEQAKGELEQMEADRDRLQTQLDEATGEKYRQPLRDAIRELADLDRDSAVRILSDHGATSVSNVKADKLKDVLRATLARTAVFTRNAASTANQRAADAYEAFQKF